MRNWTDNIEDCNVQVDGAWKMDQTGEVKTIRATIGWIMHTKEGEMSQGCKRVHASTPLQTEGYALLQGIISSIKAHLKNPLIWRDSRVLVSCINNVRECPKELRSIVAYIMLLCERFQAVKIIYVPISKIVNAHVLATKARKGDGFN